MCRAPDAKAADAKAGLFCVFVCWAVLKHFEAGEVAETQLDEPACSTPAEARLSMCCACMKSIFIKCSCSSM